jgi:hypothetical protein
MLKLYFDINCKLIYTYYALWNLYIYLHTQLQQKLKGIDLFTVHKILFTLSQFTVD